ncbi:SAM-dependent methyltransferase [Actinoallomurus sp. NPDC052308]|uniref:SAM-dependent methyltransferase n=1 Tax=Actinoallomurus sp. NPDC052308 TaxID=3155530 RepID=UPI0034389A19
MGSVVSMRRSAFDRAWPYEPEEAYEDAAAGGIDAAAPNVARVDNYYLGGKDNFAVDRDLAERALREAPVIARLVQVNRGFLHRTARFLAAERGIRQFLDIGCGLPTEINLDETVREIDPDCRVAYVDNDPMVLTHARALMAVDGGVGVYEADLREPSTVLGDPDLLRLLDLTEPVAVFLLNVLPFVPGNPRRIVDELVRYLPTGSHVVVSHVERTPDLEAVADLYEEAGLSFIPRSRFEIARIAHGLDPVAPYPAGLPLSRSGGEPEAADAVPLIGCVGRRR